MRPSKAWRVALAITSVFAVGGGVALYTLGRSGRSALDEQLALARKEGIATTFADLAPNPPVSDAENAAPFYLRAVEELRPHERALYALLERRKAFDIHNPADQAAFVKLYAAIGPAVHDFIAGAEHPRCDFHWDLDRGPLNSRIGVAPTRLLLDAITSQAELLSTEGRPVQGLDLVRSIAAFARHFIDYRVPFLFNLLRVEQGSNAVRGAVASALLKHGRERGVPEAALAALDALGPEPDIVKAWIGENVFATSQLKPGAVKDVIATYRLSGRIGKEAAMYEADSMIPGVVDRWKTLEFQVTRQLVDAARADREDLVHLADDAARIESAAAMPGDLGHAYARLRHGFGLAKPIIEEVAPLVSRRRVMVQAASVFEAWNRTGKLPDALPMAGLAGRDAIDGGSLQYTHTGAGFTITAIRPSSVWPSTPGSFGADSAYEFRYPPGP